MSALHASLVAAQKAFAPALKTSTNPHFRSRYADLAACVEAVLDALNDNGIYLMQRTDTAEATVTVETVLVHESGEMLEAGRLTLPVGKPDAQGFGSALTYARRYSLMAACGIAPEDDDGNASIKPKAATITADQALDIHAKAEEVGADWAKFLGYLGVKAIEELPAARYTQALTALEAKRK